MFSESSVTIRKEEGFCSEVYHRVGGYHSGTNSVRTFTKTCRSKKMDIAWENQTQALLLGRKHCTSSHSFSLYFHVTWKKQSEQYPGIVRKALLSCTFWSKVCELFQLWKSTCGSILWKERVIVLDNAYCMDCNSGFGPLVLVVHQVLVEKFFFKLFSSGFAQCGTQISSSLEVEPVSKWNQVSTKWSIYPNYSKRMHGRRDCYMAVPWEFPGIWDPWGVFQLSWRRIGVLGPNRILMHLNNFKNQGWCTRRSFEIGIRLCGTVPLIFGKGTKLTVLPG